MVWKCTCLQRPVATGIGLRPPKAYVSTGIRHSETQTALLYSIPHESSIIIHLDRETISSANSDHAFPKAKKGSHCRQSLCRQVILPFLARWQIPNRYAGKSSLAVQFVDGHFVDSYYPTIENTFSKTIKYKGQDFATEIVDTAGQVRRSDFPVLMSMLTQSTGWI